MPQTNDALCLGEAIKAYRAQHNEELDEHARKLLTRLAASDDAADAFERLKPKGDDGEAAIIRVRQSARTRAYLKRLKKGSPQIVKAIEQQLKPEDRGKAVHGQAAIIRACIEAENLARTFPDRVKKAKEMREMLKRRRKPLRKAVATLRRFLNEIINEQQKPPDPLWVRGPETDEDIKAMGLGLVLIERRIEYVEKHVAELNLFRLRATRKSKAPRAGQTAVIGRFADEVRRVTGKAHYNEIADLMDIILRTRGPISCEQVRATQKPRQGHWQWVKPKPHTVVRSRTK
jgi:hypothetical protein